MKHLKKVIGGCSPARAKSTVHQESLCTANGDYEWPDLWYHQVSNNLFIMMIRFTSLKDQVKKEIRLVPIGPN